MAVVYAALGILLSGQQSKSRLVDQQVHSINARAVRKRRYTLTRYHGPTSSSLTSQAAVLYIVVI